MATDVDRLRTLLAVAGVEVSEDRLPGLAAALSAALEAAESIRTEPTPMPKPSAFDPAWSEKA